MSSTIGSTPAVLPVTPSTQPLKTPVKPKVDTPPVVPASEVTTDKVEVKNATASAEFDPTVAVFPEKEVLPSLDEPITKVIKGPELEARFKAIAIEIKDKLKDAEMTHAVALKTLNENGSFGNDAINSVLRAQHAVDALKHLETLVNSKDANAVKQLQHFLQKSATGTETGSKMGVDNDYGPNSDKFTLERVRKADSTYVDRDFSYKPQPTFVYQKGEIGNGGTAMEGQGNCGPASMAMIINGMGGKAPSMTDIRKDANAKTGNAKGTYAIDSDQMERGLKKTLGKQGISVETDVQLFKGKDTNKLLDAMREGLKKGDQLVLLTANLETASPGHYIVVKEVRDDGSIVVNDPQFENGENQVHTLKELQAGVKARGNSLTRLISVRPAEKDAS